jgi:hypothetical protein
MDITGATSCPVSGEEVTHMSVKERILTIRLIEKLSANPAYAEALGIAVKHPPVDPGRQTASEIVSKP